MKRTIITLALVTATSLWLIAASTSRAATELPVIQFEKAAYSFKEGDDVNTKVTVTRKGDTAGSSTIRYETSDGTANGRHDYGFAAGKLTFGPGETSKDIPLLIMDDMMVNGTRSFTVILSEPIGATIGNPSTATVTVEDNDTQDGLCPMWGSGFRDDFFVHQHYMDFLNRHPDEAGMQFWMGQTGACGMMRGCDPDEKRINVSASFFLSIEFQETGNFVYLMHQTAFGRGEHLPMKTFFADMQQMGRGVVVGQGDWRGMLEQNRSAFVEEFATRPEFVAAFPVESTNEMFVDTLNANAHGALTKEQRNGLVDKLNQGQMTRAAALRAVAENDVFRAAEYNRAFVLMEYFGYLRREPDAEGFNFWLNKLNQFHGDYIASEMVKAFITSAEYQHRFSR